MFYGPAIFGGAGDDIIREATGAGHGGEGNDTLIGGDPEYHGYESANLHGDAGDDLILGGGDGRAGDDLGGYADRAYGGAGNDRLMGGELWGGEGVDRFYFRGNKDGTYGRAGYETHGFVKDFEAGESILLDRAQVPSGRYDTDGYAILRNVTVDEITLGRAGDDLVLTGPVMRDPHGYSVHSTMTIEGFFARDLTSITIGGASFATIGL